MENPSPSASNRWLRLPASVLRRPDLSSGCKLLLGTLCQLTGSNGHCWPSHQYLADELGVSRKTIQNHLQALSRAKLIQIQTGRAGAALRYYPFLEASTCSGGGHAALPTISPTGKETSSSSVGGHVVQPSVLPANKVAERCVKVTQGCVTFTHNNINNINTYPPYPPRRESQGSASRFTPEAGEAEFAHLWAAWPVHQGEKDARRVFLRLRRANALPEVNALIRTVATFKEQDSRWMRGKVKLLSNWLRGHCWNDQPHVEQRYPAGSRVTSASLWPLSPAIPRGMIEQVQNTKQAYSQKEPPSPLPEPDALEKLVSLWPERPEDCMKPMICGAWRHTLSARSLSGTRIVEAAKLYLANVDKPLRLGEWLRMECPRVDFNTA